MDHKSEKVMDKILGEKRLKSQYLRTKKMGG
jgi:hypothetical protein